MLVSTCLFEVGLFEDPPFGGKRMSKFGEVAPFEESLAIVIFEFFEGKGSKIGLKFKVRSTLVIVSANVVFQLVAANRIWNV